MGVWGAGWDRYGGRGKARAGHHWDAGACHLMGWASIQPSRWHIRRCTTAELASLAKPPLALRSARILDRSRIAKELKAALVSVCTRAYLEVDRLIRTQLDFALIERPKAAKHLDARLP